MLSGEQDLLHDHVRPKGSCDAQTAHLTVVFCCCSNNLIVCWKAEVEYKLGRTYQQSQSQFAALFVPDLS